MTVSTVNFRTSYIGNSTTVIFSFPYKFFDETHLNVYIDNELKVLNTDYTVTLLGEEGSVTFTVAPTTGSSVVLVRNTPLTQEIDYIVGDSFPAESHESALDKLTLIEQEIKGNIQRGIVLGESVADSPSLSIDYDVAGSVNKVVAFDVNGDIDLVNNPANDASDSADSASDSADSASDSATSASDSATSAETSLNEFNDMYLGAKTSDPNTDNDGDPLQTGSFYFNTTDDRIRIYNGTVFIDSVSEAYVPPIGSVVKVGVIRKDPIIVTNVVGSNTSVVITHIPDFDYVTTPQKAGNKLIINYTLNMGVEATTPIDETNGFARSVLLYVERHIAGETVGTGSNIFAFINNQNPHDNEPWLIPIQFVDENTLGVETTYSLSVQTAYTGRLIFNSYSSMQDSTTSTVVATEVNAETIL